MLNKTKVIESLKACAGSEKNCEKCICNDWLFDTCQSVLLKKALMVIDAYECEIKELKECVNDSIKDIQNIIGG